MGKIVKSLEGQDWFVSLVEEIQAIRVEGIFDARQRVIEMHWQIGKRLLEEYNNFERAKIYGREIAKCVAVSLGCSPRTIEQSIQFAKKFPDLKEIENLPEGKNLSWHKIIKQYLPEKSGKLHQHQWEKVWWCPICRAIKKEPLRDGGIYEPKDK